MKVQGEFVESIKIRNQLSPAKLVWALGIAIFLIEACIMWVLDKFSLKGSRWEILLDPGILLVLVIPILVLLYQESTRRIRADREIELEKDKFKAIFDGSGDGVRVIDKNCNVLMANSKMSELTGIPPEQQVGMKCYAHLSSDTCNTKGCTLSRILKGEPVVKGEKLCKGKYGQIWTVYVATPFIVNNQLLGIIESFRDISELKQIEQALKESQRRFKEIFDNIPESVAVYKVRDNGEIVFTGWNQAAESIHKLPARSVLGKNITEIYPEADQIGLISWIRQVHENAQSLKVAPSPQEKARLINGARWYEYSLYKSGDEVVVISKDITDAVMADEMAKYQLLFEDTNDAIFLYDPQGQIIMVNEVASQLLGYKKKEFLQLQIGNIIPEYPEDIKRELRDNGRAVFESIHVAKDGREIPVEVSAKLLIYGGREVILALARDITERKQAEKERTELEAQLFQAQRIGTIGLLASGIAHDFNNLLGIISTATELLSSKIKEEGLSKYLNIIQSAVERGQSTTDRMLKFVKRESLELAPVSLFEVMTAIGHILKYSLPKNIVVAIKKTTDRDTILGDKSQLQQVLMNLCLNAVDAMPMGGHLTLTLDKISGRDLKRSFKKARDVDYLCLSVSDTGIGMDKETLSHIFEPFFTTKGDLKGTGLGLCVLNDIIKSHQGFIDVKSRPGKGSTFSLYFPLTIQKTIGLIPEPLEEVKNEREDKMTHIPTGQTILVVDDEIPLGEMLKEILTNAGYKVELARDGQEGLNIYQRKKETIDLILADLNMPKVNGEELFQAIKKLKADAKAILTTGYVGVPHESELLKKGVKGIVKKPFRSIDLIRLIQKTLCPKAPAKTSG